MKQVGQISVHVYNICNYSQYNLSSFSAWTESLKCFVLSFQKVMAVLDLFIEQPMKEKKWL